MYLGFDFHVCLLLKIAPAILVPWDADNFFAKFVNSSNRKRNGGEGVVEGFSPFVCMCHRIIMKLVLVFSRRTYYKYSLIPLNLLEL